MGKWSELKAAEKARVIQFAIRQGVSDIQTIRDTFNNIYAQGGKIHIDPSKKGTFTAEASKHGKSVQAFASQVLAHKENYSPAMVKKAVFAHNSKSWKHADGGSNWLPDFTYNPSIQSHSGRQLVQSVLQDENIQRAVQQKALQRQEEIEAQRKAVSEIYNGMPNPGAGYVSGTDPLLQAIVDMTPAGDAEMATEAVSELKSGNLKEAGILGAALLIPNALNKGFKEWRKGRKLSKELSEIPLVQTVSDDKINNWLAERWYKNEIHELPPRLGDRAVDVSEFNKYGIPRHLSVIENMPTTNPNPSNTLIHVDHRLPLIPDRTGFRPLPYDYSTPAVWWNRDYPYYPAPATLTPIGHTLKVKEGRVRVLDPSVRTPNSYGPTVVTEGVLPYDALEGIRFNADQSWFEREVFKQSPARWDYFKYGPAWLTYSTGGPLYSFSFSKEPLPQVRYNNGGILGHQYGIGDWLKGLFTKNKPAESIPESVSTNQGPITAGPIDISDIASRQAYTESGYKDTAKSRVGAAGIYQIMEPALADYNKKHGTNFSLQDLADTDTSIDVRNWYMNDLLNASFINKPQSTDSIKYAKALAAYNWGRGNVSKVLNKAKSEGVDIYDSWDWLPYLAEEPRDYVNFILRGINTNLTHQNDSMYQLSKSLNKSKDTKIREKAK